jgi:hypothetical protein
MRAPIVVWWVWVAFVVINVIDMAIQWHHRAALVYAAFLAVGTGIAYACALRPRVIADDAGITILNPLRDCVVPWGAIRAVELGEAVQVRYSLPHGTDKVSSCWALFASSRAQLKADVSARRRDAGLSKLSPSFARPPAAAREITARTEAQLIATQLHERAERARAGVPAAGTPTASWAWPAIAALVAPCIVLAALLLT